MTERIMQSNLRYIPWFLLYSRLGTAFFFAFVGTRENLYIGNESWFLFLFCFGFIGDILDGIVARYLKTDTAVMRRLDSLFDILFWLATTFLLFMNYDEIRTVILYGAVSVLSVVLVEYIICFFRFGKNPSAHNWLSKIFGASLFVFYTMIFLGFSPALFGIATFGIGLVARLDALTIYLVVKEWTHDVPSFYHAYLIREGRTFKKNRFFHSEHQIRS